MARSKPRAALTHFDPQGRAHMVDVGAKRVTHRVAIAAGRIGMQATTLERVARGTAAKGDVLAVARIAAIQAAKRTADLIPLAHPIALTRVAVDFRLDARDPAVEITARVECQGQTGVEMEALSAAAVGLLTIYDMLKAIDRAMTITDVMLLEKRGGRSGTFRRAKGNAGIARRKKNKPASGNK